MREIAVAMFFAVVLLGCEQSGGGGATTGPAPITLEDLNGLILLSADECPSGPGWETVTGYEGRLIAVDESVSGEPSTKDANPVSLTVDLRGPCEGAGRLGVSNAPASTQKPEGGTLCNRSRKNLAHVHDQVGFRLCRVALD